MSFYTGATSCDGAPPLLRVLQPASPHSLFDLALFTLSLQWGHTIPIPYLYDSTCMLPTLLPKASSRAFLHCTLTTVLPHCSRRTRKRKRGRPRNHLTFMEVPTGETSGGLPEACAVIKFGVTPYGAPNVEITIPFVPSLHQVNRLIRIIFDEHCKTRNSPPPRTPKYFLHVF